MKTTILRLFIALAVVGLLVLAVSWKELSKMDVTRGHNRSAWQLPDQVAGALAMEPDFQIADIGAGGGYFTLRLADYIGRDGKLYAVEPEEKLFKFLEKRIERRELPNVEVIQGTPDDPQLPDGAIDLAFLCNSYLKIDGRAEYFRRLKADLRPGGRVAVIDFRENIVGLTWLFVRGKPRLPRATLLEEMEAAGYRHVESFDFLPVQIFEIFAPAES